MCACVRARACARAVATGVRWCRLHSVVPRAAHLRVRCWILPRAGREQLQRRRGREGATHRGGSGDAASFPAGSARAAGADAEGCKLRRECVVPAGAHGAQLGTAGWAAVAADGLRRRRCRLAATGKAAAGCAHAHVLTAAAGWAVAPAAPRRAGGPNRGLQARPPLLQQLPVTLQSLLLFRTLPLPPHGASAFCCQSGLPGCGGAGCCVDARATGYQARAAGVRVSPLQPVLPAPGPYCSCCCW